MSADSASSKQTDPNLEPEDAESTAQNGAEAADPSDPAAENAGPNLEEEVAELKDRLLRNQAEFQNFRRRSEKERLEFSQYASMEAVRELLPILDDFERALGVECADAEYVKGMQLIHQRLADLLKKLGLEPIETKGQPFDPNLHHAVEMAETDEAPDHTVLEEYQKGYNFKGRLLRAAMVKVAVNPGEASE